MQDVSLANQPLLYIGNSSAALGVTETEVSQDDLTSQAGGKACTLKTIDTVSLDLSVFNASAANIARAIFGTEVSQAATAIVAESIVGFLGALIPTKRVINTTVPPVVKDTSATPVTYVLNTDYVVNSAGIEVVPGSSLETAILASALVGTPKRLLLTIGYTPKADSAIEALAAGGKSYRVRIQGLNRADSGKEEIWDIWNVAFGPTGTFQIISKDFSSFDVKGNITPDTTRPPGESQYFKVTVVS